tara:strand:+ start:17 stop:418 length:402 start_codon:yes stop_codon:yes gene_type:complete
MDKLTISELKELCTKSKISLKKSDGRMKLKKDLVKDLNIQHGGTCGCGGNCNGNCNGNCKGNKNNAKGGGCADHSVTTSRRRKSSKRKLSRRRKSKSSSKGRRRKSRSSSKGRRRKSRSSSKGRRRRSRSKSN